MALVPDDHFSLMTQSSSSGNNSCLWFRDSRCSNHMTGVKRSFAKLDQSFKLIVHLGDKKKIVVEGKGMVRIDTIEC